MGSSIRVKTHGFKKAAKKFKNLTRSLQHELPNMLEKAGYDFLDVVQDEIIAKQVVDTRRLLNSFDKGSEGNVWRLTGSGKALTLNVGTNVEYARLVNDGHNTVSAKSVSGFLADGTPYRWVPGRWSGDSFEYDPSSEEGMMLKWKHIDGQPYWDDAVEVFEKMFQKQFDLYVSNWLKKQ